MFLASLPLRSLPRLSAAVAALAFIAGCGGGRDAPVEPAAVDAGATLGVADIPVGRLDTGTATIGWSNAPGGVAIAADAAENIYTVRWDYNPAGDIYLAKRSAAGALLWEVRHDNTDTTRHEVATWVDADAAGNVFVSGTVRSGYSNPVNANSLLMKYAPDGRQLWRRVYDGNFDGSSTRKLLVDAEGNAYVLGLGTSPSNGQRTTVRKFAPDGTQQWAWFDPVGIGAPLNIKWTADGALVISARALFGSLNGYARIDRDGRTLWTLPAISSLTAGDIAGDAAGNSYLINQNYATGSGSLLRKVNADGITLWERSHPIAGLRVEVARDGAAVVSGYPSASAFGAAFAKFSSAGALLWTNADADGAGVALLAHAQMRLDANDNAYLAASNMSQMGVTRVNTDGTSAWTSLVPFSYAYGLAFGASERVYVVGGTTARINGQAGTTEPPPPPPPPPPAPPPPPPPPTPPPAPTTPTPPPAPTTPNADLSVVLTDSPDPVRVSSRLVYTATVLNRGPSAATLVNLIASLPPETSVQSVSASQGRCTAGTATTCALGSIASGGQATVVITVRTKTRGFLTASVSVSAAEADPVSSNNLAMQGTTVVRR